MCSLIKITIDSLSRYSFLPQVDSHSLHSGSSLGPLLGSASNVQVQDPKQPLACVVGPSPAAASSNDGTNWSQISGSLPDLTNFNMNPNRTQPHGGVSKNNDANHRITSPACSPVRLHSRPFIDTYKKDKKKKKSVTPAFSRKLKWLRNESIKVPVLLTRAAK